MRIIAALLLALTFAGAALAEGPSEADSGAIQGTIRSQLEAFKADDGEAAYSYAAPNVKAIFPTADAFMTMVKRAYQPVYRPKSYTFGKLEEKSGSADPVGRDPRPGRRLLDRRLHDRPPGRRQLEDHRLRDRQERGRSGLRLRSVPVRARSSTSGSGKRGEGDPGARDGAGPAAGMTGWGGRGRSRLSRCSAGMTGLVGRANPLPALRATLPEDGEGFGGGAGSHPPKTERIRRGRGFPPRFRGGIRRGRGNPSPVSGRVAPEGRRVGGPVIPGAAAHGAGPRSGIAGAKTPLRRAVPALAMLGRDGGVGRFARAPPGASRHPPRRRGGAGSLPRRRGGIRRGRGNPSPVSGRVAPEGRRVGGPSSPARRRTAPAPDPGSRAQRRPFGGRSRLSRCSAGMAGLGGSRQSLPHPASPGMTRGCSDDRGRDASFRLPRRVGRELVTALMRSWRVTGALPDRATARSSRGGPPR